VGRRLGQHFLTDTAILDRIVAAINPAADDVVVEIGPGQGTLTRRLAPVVGHVVAIEKDEALARGRREKGEERRENGNRWPSNVTLVHAYALDVDWSVLSSPFSLLPSRSFKVIGNIPYYITSPLIEKALSTPQASVVVFLVQKEVADRLVAEPGGKIYGALSVGVQATAKVERVLTVKAGAFHPPPKVDSAAVRLTPLATPLVRPEEVAPFRAFTVRLFGQRRKQLVRSLRETQGLSAEQAAAALHATGIEPCDRAETVAPSRLVALFRALPR